MAQQSTDPQNKTPLYKNGDRGVIKTPNKSGVRVGKCVVIHNDPIQFREHPEKIIQIQYLNGQVDNIYQVDFIPLRIYKATVENTPLPETNF